MSSEIADIVIPSIFFFIAFFVAFTLAETLIILLLNRLMFKVWGFTVEGLTKSKELYGKEVRIITGVIIVVLILGMLGFTDLLGILRGATLEIKVLALETFLAMILIYLTTTRRLPQLPVEKAIHKYLYVYLSIIVFTLTITMADRHYERYQDFINANVTTTIRGVDKKIESQEKTALVENFRKQLYQGQCSEINYLDEPAVAGVTNFVYVSTSDDLIRTQKSYEQDPDAAKDLRGRLCSNGIESFLLTDHGRWYWVIES